MDHNVLTEEVRLFQKLKITFLKKITTRLLDTNPYQTDPAQYDIIEFILDLLPSDNNCLNKMLYKTPLMTISNMNNLLVFYGI